MAKGIEEERSGDQFTYIYILSKRKEKKNEVDISHSKKVVVFIMNIIYYYDDAVICGEPIIIYIQHTKVEEINEY